MIINSVINKGTGEANLGVKNINENGTYNAEADGLDGYSSVVVAVEGTGGGEIILDPLSNPASAKDIVASKEAYDDSGTKIVGTIPIYDGIINVNSNCTLSVGGKYVPNNIAVNIEGGTNLLAGLINNTITTLVLPSGITSVKEYLCKDNSSLVTLDLTGANSVAQYAFNNCRNINSLTLPKTLTNIATYAFYYAGYSKSNPFALETNNVCTVGNYAFQYARLSSVKGKYSSIGSYAFANSPSLSEININQCSSLSTYAFYNDTNLKTIAFKINGSIGSYSFYGSTAVNNCVFDTSSIITSLGDFAFSRFASNRANADSNIITLDFRNSTFTTIPQYCFGGDSSTISYRNKYMKLMFPKTVTTIGNYAFRYTDNCDMYFASETPPSLSVTTAWTNATSYNIFVPYTAVNDYRLATNWSTQASYIKGYADANTFNVGDVLPVMSDGFAVTWYSDKDCTTEVTTVTDVSSIYYCVVGTTKLAYQIISIKEKDCVISVTDGTKSYIEGDWVPTNTVLTISAVSSVTGYILKHFKVNGVAFNSGDTYTMTADLTVDVRYYDGVSAAIYGVSGEGASSPVLTRTDDAVGLGYTVGASEIASDFDSCYPWSDMVEYTDAFGNKFIRIPKFYTQYTFDENGLKTTKISEMPEDDTWKLNPIFLDASGNELDYFCIGKYDAGLDSSNRLTSVSGVSPRVSATRASFRTWARNCGTGYQQLDIWAVVALQDLFKIEFATLNSQSVMKGYTSGSAVITSGRTDSVATASGSQTSNTSGSYAMKYRGIENFYGNVFQWVDGVNINNRVNYVCYDATKYKDDTTTDYAQVAYTNAGDGWIKKLGYDEKHPFVHMPIAVGGSDTTYYSDYHYYNSGWRVAFFGGSYGSGADAGAFYWTLYNSSSSTHSSIGGRLLYRPL